MVRNSVLFALALVFMLAYPQPVTAAVELYLSDFSGDARQVQILPGQSLQVHIGLATNESTFGAGYWLTIAGSGSGKFTLTDRILPPDCKFPRLITANTELLSPGAAILDPTHDRDLGALAPDGVTPQSPGVYILATVTIASAADIPLGSYTLSFSNAIGAGVNFEDVPIATHDYMIVVTDTLDEDPTNADTDTTDGNDDPTTDTDADTNSDATTDTDSGTTSGDDTANTGTELLPVITSTARCGAGFGAVSLFGLTVALGLIRPSVRSRLDLQS